MLLLDFSLANCDSKLQVIVGGQIIAWWKQF